MAHTRTSAREQVQEAYLAYYGRPADPAGLEYWADQLTQSGSAMGAIIDAFGNSAESQSLYSGATNAQKVTQVYQQLFGRDPETTGLNYYVSQLDKGAITLQSFALDVLNGAQGGDHELLNKKLAVAENFTNQLSAQGAGNTYKGDDDAASARDLLARVTLSTDVDGFNTQVDELIDKIYDNSWYTYGGDYAETFYNGFVSDDQETYHLNDVSSRNGNGANYNSDIFVAKIDADLSTDKQVLVGDASNQYLDASTLAEDGSLVLAGTQDRNKAFVTRLDTELNETGAVVIGTGQGVVELEALDSGSNGRTVAVGYQSDQADAKDAYIVSLNSDMTVHAQRRIDDINQVNSDETLENVKVLSDNSVIAWTDDKFLKFDQDLRLQKALDFDFTPHALMELDNGNLLAFDRISWTPDVTLLDADLNVLKAWQSDDAGYLYSSASNDDSLVGLWRGWIGDSHRNILTFDPADFTQDASSITPTDTKYITDRDGNLLILDDVFQDEANFVVREDENLFTFKPNHETSQSLATDYSFIENDKVLTLQAMDETSRYYPSSVELAWDDADVSLVGVADFSTVQVNGGMNIVHNDTL